MNTINEITKILYKIKPEINWNDTSLYNEPLTGSIIKMNAPDLVYLVLELKNHFKTEFQSCDFDDFNFNTINSIAKIIESRV